ncbi:hypothetical protein [Niallia endozanthoxylica]|uniref:Uncharacterized protein n=1 Tax=Niallia endozanthoxylica TaxID=2036016 RepID=A0A5J5HWX6_9BACI|nr:hypothetical protein [Niallia endozanthoxylica]KAA9027491.1 hypothetical protein F4V44_05700 [Niallia endozanthoxylica]
MEEFFSYNERLGIKLPSIDVEWDDLSDETQESILLYWENIRGAIPDQIISLEKTINKKQAQLNDESDFQQSCQLNSEIADLASVINDLWLWFRLNQNISEKMHQ